jgi:ankyrin repeat protein
MGSLLDKIPNKNEFKASEINYETYYIREIEIKITRRKSNEDLKKYLQQININATCKDSSKDYEYTLLINATKINDIKLVQVLLEIGADPNIKTFYGGKTALYYAIENNNYEFVRALLKHGADFSLQYLMYSVRENHNNKYFKIIKALIKAGSDVNENDVYKNTSLYYAVQNNDIKCINLLIKAGANVNAINDCFDSILISAIHNYVYNNSLKIIRVLLKAGANINYKNGRPLIIALIRNNRKIIKELLKWNVNINNLNTGTSFSWFCEKKRIQLQKNFSLIYSSKFIPFFHKKSTIINENIIREAMGFF